MNTSIILKELTLKNFKAHEFRKISFNKHQNLILGKNGVGKSTIFHAILFALFGHNKKVLSQILGAKKNENLIRYGATSAEISLKFYVGDTLYEIYKTIRKNESSTVDLFKYENGKQILIANGAENVFKKIKKIIKLDATKVQYINYIGQGKLGELIEKSSKKEFTLIIEEIFGIKEYSILKEIIDRVQRKLNKDLNQIKEYYNSIKRNISYYETKFKGYTEEEIRNLINKKEKLEQEYEKINSIYIQAKKFKESIDYNKILEKDEVIKKIEILNTEIEDINKKLGEYYNLKKTLQFNIELAKDYIKYSLEDLSKMLDSYKDIDISKKTDLKLKLKDLKDIVQLIDRYLELIKIKDEIKIIDREYNSITEEINKIELIIKEAEKAIQVLKESSDNKCPVCNSPLSEESKKKLILEKEETIKNNLKKLKNLKLKKEEIFRKKRILDRQMGELNYIQEKLIKKGIKDLYEQNLLEIKNKYLSEIKKIEEELKEIETYEKILNAYNYKQYKNIDFKIKELLNSLNTLKRELYTYQKKYEDITKIEKYKEDLEKLLQNNNFKSFEELENKYFSLKKEYLSYKNISKSEIDTYLRFKKELEDYKNKILKINKNIQLLIKFSRILEIFINKYRIQVANLLKKILPIKFKEIYKYDDIISVEVNLTQNFRKEHIFDIYIIKRIDNKEHRKPLSEALLSGGQKKALDLALRLSLIEILNPNFRVILLDEPTESLDEEVRKNLAEVIKNLKDYQIILCTHDELFRDILNVDPIEL